MDYNRKWVEKSCWKEKEKEIMCNKDGSYRGQCCCECVNQLEIRKHPWNKLAKGPISEVFG